MSRRGEIVIECDSEDCAAEELFCPDNFEGATLEYRLDERKWDAIGSRKHRRDVCSQCAGEIADGLRCGECCASFGDDGKGDCYCGVRSVGVA